MVGDPKFLLRKEIERKISLKYPEKYRDLYSMISFTCMPYIEALRIHRERRAIIDEIVNLEPRQGAANGKEIDYAIDELMRNG